MEGIMLLLGTNLGDRIGNLRRAHHELQLRRVAILQSSSVWESAPWGKTDQPWFLNMVMRVDFDGEPARLLKTLLTIEEVMGRKRFEKWGERVIDIDLLYFGDQCIEQPELIVPHPGIPDRRFTLEPLAEIAAQQIDPSTRKPVQQMLEACSDQLECFKSNLSIANDAF